MATTIGFCATARTRQVKVAGTTEYGSCVAALVRAPCLKARFLVPFGGAERENPSEEPEFCVVFLPLISKTIGSSPLSTPLEVDSIGIIHNREQQKHCLLMTDSCSV